MVQALQQYFNVDENTIDTMNVLWSTPTPITMVLWCMHLRNYWQHHRHWQWQLPETASSCHHFHELVHHSSARTQAVTAKDHQWFTSHVREYAMLVTTRYAFLFPLAPLLPPLPHFLLLLYIGPYRLDTKLWTSYHMPRNMKDIPIMPCQFFMGSRMDARWHWISIGIHLKWQSWWW